jgi:hypothetical protein
MVLWRPKLKYKVSPIDPKYAAVKGRRGVDIRCWKYVHGPIMAAQDARNNTEPKDHRMANLRGFSDSTGKSAKQITKQARAPRLQPPKTSSRSHLLKVNQPSSSSRLLGAGSGAPELSVVGS